MEDKQITNFIFELGHLRKIKHEGWRLAGVEHPDSVAEHSLRVAQIAFILAHMERYDNPNEVVTMAIFHDIGECRIGDLHKVASRYVTADEERAVKEQTEKLDNMGKEIFNLWSQVDNKSTRAGIIAKDADYIEQAFMAKEYIEQGHLLAQDWINNIKKAIKTDSAHKLVKSLEASNSTDWWQGLKKLK